MQMNSPEASVLEVSGEFLFGVYSFAGVLLLAGASGKNVAAEKAGDFSGFFRTRRARIIFGGDERLVGDVSSSF